MFLVETASFEGENDCERFVSGDTSLSLFSAWLLASCEDMSGGASLIVP